MRKGECIVSGCLNKIIVAKGMCSTHYSNSKYSFKINCKICGIEIKRNKKNFSKLKYPDVCNTCRMSKENKKRWANRSEKEKKEIFNKSAKTQKGRTWKDYNWSKPIETMRKELIERTFLLHKNHPEISKKLGEMGSKYGKSCGGKNLEEIYGEEKANKIKEKLRSHADIYRENGRKSKGGGRCKWYNYKNKKGDIIKLQGIYEVLVAYYLDYINVFYLPHYGWWDIGNKKFLPDFYLPRIHRFLEPKNSYRVKTQKYCDLMPWILITEKELKEIGLFKYYRKVFRFCKGKKDIDYAQLFNIIGEGKKPMRIICEGNISCGKSTLSEKLADALGMKLYKEPLEENPYLSLYYQNPKKYAFGMQMWLATARLNQHIEAEEYLLKTGNCTIMDRSLWGDIIFEEVNHEDGNIDDLGNQTYKNIRRSFSNLINPPDLVLYLKTDPEVCYKRIHDLRKRECESSVSLEYLKKLNVKYEKLMEEFKSLGAKVYILDWNEFKPVNELIDNLRELGLIEK